MIRYDDKVELEEKVDLKENNNFSDLLFFDINQGKKIKAIIGDSSYVVGYIDGILNVKGSMIEIANNNSNLKFGRNQIKNIVIGERGEIVISFKTGLVLKLLDK